MKATKSSRRVAIVYHYLAHYREAVFETLSRPAARHHYVIFSDRQSNIPSLATIAPEKSRSRPAGRLNWRFIRNRWLTQCALAERCVRIALSREFDAVILLGNMQFLSTWIAALLARVIGKRVLMWTHGVLRRERGVRGCVRRLSIGWRMACYCMDIGRGTCWASRASGPTSSMWSTIPWTRPHSSAHSRPRRHAFARRAVDIPADTPLLVYVGRLVAGKDLHLLPQAVSNLRNAATTSISCWLGRARSARRSNAASETEVFSRCISWARSIRRASCAR